MYFMQEEDEGDRQVGAIEPSSEESDLFEGFGELEAANDTFASADEEDHLNLSQDEVMSDSPHDDADFEFPPHAIDVSRNEPAAPAPMKTGFSWAGFAGGMAALIWIAAAIGGPLSYFGQDGLMALDPAMQAGLIALAFGPALLFWISASAAGEALKARRMAAELTRIAQEARTPVEAGEADAKKLSAIVKHEIECMNDAVAAALDRLAELETAAQRNASLFSDAVAASRENTEAMSQTLARERDALNELNIDLKGQTETVATSISRQVRLLRETSTLVKTEIIAAEDTLETHLASFADAASLMGERTAAFQHVANDAASATESLNGVMANMLDGLAEATRLSETARTSSEQAVAAAAETADAIRETTRTAVFEAKRAAQLIRSETVAMQEAANDTLAKLQETAHAARAASEESQAAANRHAAAIEKRLGALASVAGSKPAPAVARPVQIVAQTQATPRAVAKAQHPAPQPRPAAAANFMPPRPTAPVAANDGSAALINVRHAPKTPDAALKSAALELVFNAGVDLDDVLRPADLDRIARSAREGASARRRAVLSAAPGAVGRVTRHLQRNGAAHGLAAQFRTRPDLTKSEKKSEASDLVRAYLLIDAALA